LSRPAQAWHSPGPLSAPQLWGVVLSLGSGVLLAYGLRHGLVEPAALTHRCEALEASWVCEVRRWTVAAFVHQRLAWVALGLAVLALVARLAHPSRSSLDQTDVRSTRAPWLVRMGQLARHGALLLGGAGLVLYAADVAALAVLMAVLL